MNPRKTDASSTILPESASIPFNDSTRCLYRYANGKRCRLTGSQPHFGLCPHQFSLAKPMASLELYNDAEDLSADLLPQLSELSPSIDLRQFLACLLILVAKGRVSPRRASVLAYITNQLLHSHPRHHSCRRFRRPVGQPFLAVLPCAGPSASLRYLLRLTFNF
jgi:hypothetical protein